jgi:hypothetical protein
MWMAIVERITKGDAKRMIGVRIKVKISKNKMTGKVREVEFPIYYDYGIDDIGSCITFLNSEKHWPGKQKIDAKELGLNTTRAALIAKIEKGGLEDDVKDVVEEVWIDVEESLKLNRKPKYGDDPD